VLAADDSEMADGWGNDAPRSGATTVDDTDGAGTDDAHAAFATTPTLRSLVDGLLTGTEALTGRGLASFLHTLLPLVGASGAQLRPAGPGHLYLPGRIDVGVPTDDGLVLEAPVTTDAELVAVLSVAGHELDERVADAAVLAVATAIGAAWATADHRRVLGEVLTTDALTELPNRRAFVDRLQRQFPAASRDTPLVVALLDVNGMLQYNDTHGHAAGDRLLIGVGELLREISGELQGTVVARLGGDEFGVLTCDHSIDEVVAALTRVQARSGSDLGVSIGCGVAQYDGDTSLVLPTDLLRLADVAQYRAKRTQSAAPVVAADGDRDLARTVAAQARADGNLASVTTLHTRRRWLRDGRHEEP
jgi:diguanylate cyclase (GGDEF)-like protein